MIMTKKTNTKNTDSHTFKFALLDEVKDTLTGYEGVVTRCAQYLTGCDRYLVQPKKLDKNTGAIPEPTWLEEWRLERKKNSALGETVMVGVKLGSKVTDKLTGFKGIAVCKTCSPSAANRVSVVKPNPKNMKDEREWIEFDESQLEISPDAPIELFNTKNKKDPPGGPNPYPAPRN